MSHCIICSFSVPKLFCQIKNFKYFLCKNCQTLFLFPTPTEKIINDYYQNNFRYEVGSLEEMRIRQRAKVILKNLIKLNPKGKTLLDVGSGFGYFLNEAKKSNFKILGLEPSKKLFLQNTLDNNVKNNTFEKYFKKNRKKFDFITLIHVIEHLNNPKKIIKLAIELLNNDGVLYIETPNLNSHLFWAEKEKYTFLTPPDHLWIFSKKSMETMFREISFEIVKTSTYTYPEHLMGIIKKKFVASNYCAQANKARLERQNKKPGMIKGLKYNLFDKILAPFFAPVLNLGGYGSILELYIKKK